MWTPYYSSFVTAVQHEKIMNSYFIKFLWKLLIIVLSITIPNLKFHLYARCTVYWRMRIGQRLPLDTTCYNRWWGCVYEKLTFIIGSVSIQCMNIIYYFSRLCNIAFASIIVRKRLIKWVKKEMAAILNG